MKQLDIIIPVKNEAKNLPQLVERIDTALAAKRIDYSLILIDDHSTDATSSVITSLAGKYPIRLYTKKGKPGKAWSIIEGAQLATSEMVAMLDADLQYPPEALPKMLDAAQGHGVVVANRKIYRGNWLRRFASRFNKLVFGQLLFGLNFDVQSGLKIFRREIIAHLDPTTIKPWALDIALLYTARSLGFPITSVDIIFELRTHGATKINYLQTTCEIVTSALALKFKGKKTFQLPPNENNSMLGAGVAHNRKRFITHSLLPFHKTALKTFTFWQKFLLAFASGLLVGGLVLTTKATLIAVVAVLSAIYFLDSLFNLFVTLKSLHFPPEINVTPEQIKRLKTQVLPIYTILCPLYREASVLPHFIEAITRLDWPKHRLEVLLLVEADDQETLTAIASMELPPYVNQIIVPNSDPRTKPKACNYGLAKAHGKYIVVYDAEDMPEALQLKKAYTAFLVSGPQYVCLQAKLNYFNPHQNLLTRLFTAEYSLWFDVILPGLQSIETAIPLGGTSNHFRTQDLKALHGWDAFNVTEDCDLGVRLFKHGLKTAIIDSVTLEEANSSLFNWIRQRSRWLKGYMQTYLVHMRTPASSWKNLGIHGLIFQLVVGLRITFMLINPILWAATIAYFALYAKVGPAIESLYPTPVFYMAAFSLVLGNFLYLYNYMLGAAKREHWTIIKYVFLVPIYWLFVSVAAVVAIFQLFIKPHYWEKTRHGLHLKKSQSFNPVQTAQIPTAFPLPGFTKAGVLIFAAIAGNIFNFLYNAYLGRTVAIEVFGQIALFGNFLYLTAIFIQALGSTVTHRTAYLLGKYKSTAHTFFAHLKKRGLKISLFVTGIWSLAIPFLINYFQATSYLPFLIFTPVWVVGTQLAIYTGFLMGNLQYMALALVITLEAAVKLAAAYLLVKSGLPGLVYLSIPISMAVALCIAWFCARRVDQTRGVLTKDGWYFPRKFFATAILNRISLVAFLSLDVILAKHYLAPKEAGEYALLSLSGKMVFFLANLFMQFINPVVSRSEGEGKKSDSAFNQLFAATMVTCILGFLAFGIFGHVSAPILFGHKVAPVIFLLPAYTLAMVYFALAATIVAYHQARRQYLHAVTSFLLVFVQIGAIAVFHTTPAHLVIVMVATGAINLIVLGALHLFYNSILDIFHNALDFLGLFSNLPKPKRLLPTKLRILIFNWRDTRHIWAGGAEVYLHELARRWVRDGHKVTLFCGNDGLLPRNEVVDGVQIVRRGGFYTVYFWAMFYYLLKFKGLFDVVIDSENGIPFFSPLYSDKPTFLLIHHVHQEVFQNHLVFPFSALARFIESKLMPFVYRHKKIVTISQSSKNDIEQLGFAGDLDIDIVNPGINSGAFISRKKASYPQILYLGRLKPYKNVDTLIEAFASVSTRHNDARLVIAGEGESMLALKNLVSKLQLDSTVAFTGRLTESKKAELLATSWIVVQPSSIEGWGLTVIEANAAGTPVVASNVNGLRDAVVDGETGILVAARNTHAFAQTLLTLIENTRLRESLSGQAKIFAKEFNWDKSAQKFKEIINRNLIQHNQRQFVGKIVITD